MDHAACAGLDVDWFVPDTERDPFGARQVCAVCPVRLECLQYALTFGRDRDHGIYGGTTSRERRRLRAALP